MKIVKPSFEIITTATQREVLSTIERVGRTCYQSQDKIAESSGAGFVRRIIDSGHESVIEHFNITVIVTNDRGVSHEEVRHRIASYAQESTRYCNYASGKHGGEITYIDIAGGIKLDPKTKNLPEDVVSQIYDEWVAACVDAEQHYLKMIDLGASPQIARSVLNNSTKTEIAITMNMRAWRHFFKMRLSKAAHPQIREIAIMLFDEFVARFPIIFEDITYSV